MQTLSYPLYAETDKFFEDESCHFLRCAVQGCQICLEKRKEMMDNFLKYKQRQRLREIKDIRLGEFYTEGELMQKLDKGEKISLGV